MLTLDVQSTIAPALKQLKTFTSDQFPFTVAKALTVTAQQAQAEVQRNMPGRFTLRRNWIVKGIVIKPATKSDLQAIVYSRDAAFMNRQELGGDKDPQSDGKYIAIPMPAVRRSKSQIILGSQLPKNLKNTFIITATDGRKYIAQRISRGAKAGVQLMYELRPVTHIKPRLGLESDSLRIAKANFVQNLINAAEYAMRTAR